MVTKEEYAKLSMEVYDGGIPVGWELIDESDPTLTSGLFAQAMCSVALRRELLLCLPY